MVVITIDSEFVRKYKGIDKEKSSCFSTLNLLDEMKKDILFDEFLILENLVDELKDENEEESDQKFFKEGIEFHIGEDAFHDLKGDYLSIMLSDFPITEIHPEAFNLDKEELTLTIWNCNLKEFNFENSQITYLIIDGKYLVNQRENILKGMKYLTGLEIGNYSDEYKNTRLNLENYIKNEYFPNLDELKFDGDFKILDKDIIKSLENIETLEYCNFKGEELYEGVFEDLGNVQELTLMTDDVDQLSNNIFGKENIISTCNIVFHYCNIENINFLSKYKPKDIEEYGINIYIDREVYVKFEKQIKALNERNNGVTIRCAQGKFLIY